MQCCASSAQSLHLTSITGKTLIFEICRNMRPHCFGEGNRVEHFSDFLRFCSTFRTAHHRFARNHQRCCKDFVKSKILPNSDCCQQNCICHEKGFHPHFLQSAKKRRATLPLRHHHNLYLNSSATCLTDFPSRLARRIT